MLKTSRIMNLPALLAFGCGCLLAVTFAQPGLDIYSDLPDDYFIEQLAKRIQQHQLEEQQRSRFQRLNTYLESDPELIDPLEQLEQQDNKPEFTYQFPPSYESPDTSSTSQFAVRPPDPRYYHDTRRALADDEEDAEDERVVEGKPEEPAYGRVIDEIQEDVVKDDDTFEVPQRATLPVQVPTTTIPPPTTEESYEAHNVQAKGDFVFESEETAAGGAGGGGGGGGNIQRKLIHAPDSEVYFIIIVAGCSAAAVAGIVLIGVSWYRLQRKAKAAADVEYPAYGVTGPNKDTSPTGDRKLAQSAQMYHYQHQKQQIIAMENRVANERHGSMSEAESDEENEEGDYTVYECPGLAPTGEMEVKNPLFQDDQTPATPAIVTNQTSKTAPGNENNVNTKK